MLNTPKLFIKIATILNVCFGIVALASHEGLSVVVAQFFFSALLISQAYSLHQAKIVLGSLLSLSACLALSQLLPEKFALDHDLAVTYGLLAISVLLLPAEAGSGRRIQSSGVVAIFAASYGIVDLLGLSHGFVPAFQLTSLLLLLFSGLVLALCAFIQLGTSGTEAYRRISLWCFSAAMIAVLGLWQISQRQEGLRYNALVSERLETVAAESQQNLDEVANALKRYAKRVEYLGFRDKTFLEIDSGSYLEQLPMLRRIGLVDAKLDVLWSFPKASSGEVTDFNQGSTPARREVFAAAAESKDSVLSQSLPLRSGETGFLLPTAISKKGQLAGFIYGAIDAQRLFSKLSKSGDFSIAVSEGGKTLFKNGDRDRLNAGFSQRTQVLVGLAKWEIAVTPTVSFFAKNRSYVPEQVFYGGILISLLIGAVAHFFAGSQNLNRSYSDWRTAVLNGAEYSIISTDARGVIQTFNKTAEKMLQYKASELVGRHTTAWFHDAAEAEKLARHLEAELGVAVPAHVDAFLIQARLRGVAHEMECSYIRKDGTRIPIRLSVTPLLSSKNEFSGYICIANDLTAKKSIEAELQVTLARLERVIEATGVGIWERRFESKEIEHVDARGKYIFGFSLDEEFDYETVIAAIHPDDMKLLQGAIAHHVENSTPRYESEFRIYNKARGEERWVRSMGQVIKKNGIPDLLISTVYDVTDSVHDRQKLEFALAEAETATTAKSAFLASMSHEIRTPLNGVIGMAGLLMNGELDSVERSYASVIFQSGNTLLRLINDILDFSKIEAGKMDLEEAAFDLSALVEVQADLLFAKAQQQDIALTTFVSPAIQQNVIGDAARISQILLNLIGNAVKFTNRGGVLVSVSPVLQTVDRRMEWLRFEIRDSGIGVSPQLAEKLFQPFVQADSSISRKFGGTGLGLSICSRLVALMGGKMGVSGVEGVGSTFWFELPLKKAPVSAIGPSSVEARSRELAQLEPAAPQFEAPFANKRALLIEDDVANLEILFLYLSHLKIEATAMTAQAAVQEATYDFVFFGSSVVESKRQKILAGLSPSSPVRPKAILIAPFGKKLNEPALYASGIDEILTSPLKRSRLLACLSTEKNSAPTQVLTGARGALSGAKRIGERAEAESKGGTSARGRLRALDVSVPTNDTWQPEIIPSENVENIGHESGELSPLGTGVNPRVEPAGVRIIVADDNSINQMVARAILDSLGYKATYAAHGQEVLDILAQAEFDLVLMDCQMPVMDGFAATREIRRSQVPAIRDIVVIALTANVSESDSRKCAEVGMNDFLPKPIVAEDLGKKIALWTALAQSKATA